MSSQQRRTVVRKCSYCNVAGHNVSNCTSPALLCYLSTLCRKYKHILGNTVDALTQRQALCIAAGGLKEYLNYVNNNDLKETLCVLVRNLKLSSNIQPIETARYLITKYILSRYVDNIYPRHIYPHLIPLNEIDLFTRTTAYYGIHCREMEEYHTFTLTDNVIPIIHLFQIRYAPTPIPRQICKVNQVEVVDIFSETFECPICYEFVDGVCVLTECEHKYCKSCFDKIKEQSEANGNFPKCAMCRGEIKKCEVSKITNNQLEEAVNK